MLQSALTGEHQHPDQRRHHQQRRAGERDEQRPEGDRRCRGLVDRDLVDEHPRVLTDPPPEHDRHHRTGGRIPGCGRSVPVQEPHRCQTAGCARHDERGRPAVEPPGEGVRIGLDRDHADQRDHTDHGPGHQRATSEVRDQVLLAVPAGVSGEQHRRGPGAHGDGQDAAQHRRGREPAAPRVAVAGRGHPARRDRADRCAEEERCDHRREREQGTEEPSLAQGGGGLPEHEGSTAEDDAAGRQEEGHVEGRRDRGERLGEPGPQVDQHEDQPHVVGLPDGSDRALDAASWSRPPAVPAGEQVPEAGAEVRAGEDGVRDHPDPDDAHHDAGQDHAEGSPSSSRDVAPTVASGGRSEPGGPYGVETSSPARQRALMRCRTNHRLRPRPR